MRAICYILIVVSALKFAIILAPEGWGEQPANSRCNELLLQLQDGMKRKNAVPGRYVVGIRAAGSSGPQTAKPGKAEKKAIVEALSNAEGLSLRPLDHLNLLMMKEIESKSGDIAVLQKILSAGLCERIETIEPDLREYAQVVPDDLSHLQWGLSNTGQDGGIAGVDTGAAAAWDLSTGSSDVVIGIIDSGIDYTHPDLSAAIFSNVNEPIDGIDNDGNGYVDDNMGWNFVDASRDPMDRLYHGTHVAGIAGASGNNGTGITGVNWSVSLLPLRFLGGDGSGLISHALAAVNYAIDLKKNRGINVRVLNNSWGSPGPCPASLRNAVRAANEAGILFVAAAGNAQWNIDQNFRQYHPASCDGVLAVAAIDRRGALASFSNFGPDSVLIAAPGVDIFSTWMKSAAQASGKEYHSISGTSMAAPFVSGAAALVAEAYPNLSPGEIMGAIADGAEPLASLEGRVLTKGMLNAGDALEAAALFPKPSPTHTPLPVDTPTPVTHFSPTPAPLITPTFTVVPGLSPPATIPPATPAPSIEGRPTAKKEPVFEFDYFKGRLRAVAKLLPDFVKRGRKSKAAGISVRRPIAEIKKASTSASMTMLAGTYRGLTLKNLSKLYRFIKAAKAPSSALKRKRLLVRRARKLIRAMLRPNPGGYAQGDSVRRIRASLTIRWGMIV